MTAITIINRETNEVKLAEQIKMSKSTMTVQFLGDEKVRRVPLGDVIILEDHRFDLLDEYAKYQRDVMLSSIAYKAAAARVTDELTADIPTKVQKAMGNWSKEHPEPPLPEALTAVMVVDENPADPVPVV